MSSQVLSVFKGFGVSPVSRHFWKMLEGWMIGRMEGRPGPSDLYIIGAVCLSQKSLFLYSKDLVVSHVYSYIPYSKELVVSVLDTFVVKGISRFHIS